MKLSVLILDDEERVRDEIEEFLSERNFSVDKAETPSRAFDILTQKDIDIMILDIKLPEMDGLQVLKKVKSENPGIEVIMISGHGDMNSVIEAMRLGATDFFQKPFRLIEINNAIERSKRFVYLNTRLKKIEQQYSLVSKELQENIGHKIIGKSSALISIIELMSKVARADHTTVLITGESGTGKELIARGIHYLSSRKGEFFYPVNCSAIPETLFESEFFGHKKGSFTGANEDKSGWFEIANNGTLFLDEIGDMPLNQQAKLLRILDEKKVKKVGSHKDINVDVRVIAASNRELLQLVNKGKFRLDLYHRLTSFTIKIPPLRERKSDIPLLLNHFTHIYAEKLGKPIREIDPEISKNLKNYNFPGNIRELKNMVERAMILSDGEKLKWSDFELVISSEHYIPDPITSYRKQLDLNEIEKSTILKALEKADYNKSKAAELLNISWQSLDRRMKKFKIANR